MKNCGPREAFRPRQAREALVAYIGRQSGMVKLRPDQKLVFRRNWDQPQARVRGVRRLMDELAKIAA